MGLTSGWGFVLSTLREHIGLGCVHVRLEPGGHRTALWAEGRDRGPGLGKAPGLRVAEFKGCFKKCSGAPRS